MTIGDKIRNYRRLAGLTQKQLGEKSGTSERTVQQYETGKRQPRIEQLRKIADALGILTTDLLGDAEIKNLPSPYYSYHLVEDLKRVGCRITVDEDEALLCIEMPEGTLVVTEQDLSELEYSTVSYLQFKLEELKKKRLKYFLPRKK